MFSTLSKYYTGFFIEQAVGNNAFSYDERRNKRIYIPAVKIGGPEDLMEGRKVVFSEVYDGKEFNKAGLEKYIYFQKKDKHIFIFDNHNHAFFFGCVHWNWVN
ncbi:FIG00512732: hypothetical protein [hydrothermal vent metagenome]|uniref:Uncharacterized protein n=1 Tax=hydrothermal vent metagenome TaxID=652676 RepID=A0A3B1E058_9ZZZZ